jgi:hypothetical protein
MKRLKVMVKRKESTLRFNPEAVQSGYFPLAG